MRIFALILLVLSVSCAQQIPSVAAVRTVSLELDQSVFATHDVTISLLPSFAVNDPETSTVLKYRRATPSTTYQFTSAADVYYLIVTVQIGDQVGQPFVYWFQRDGSRVRLSSQSGVISSVQLP